MINGCCVMTKALRYLTLILSGIICLTFHIGCGTIVHGTTQVVKVTSAPEKATVKLATGNTHTTPAAVRLSRKEDHVLVISKDGYQSEEVIILHVVSGAVAGNILLGGLIGWGIDAGTGGQYKLLPETVHVVLKPMTENKVEQRDVKVLSFGPEAKLQQLEELYIQKSISQQEYLATRQAILNKFAESGQ